MKRHVLEIVLAALLVVVPSSLFAQSEEPRTEEQQAEEEWLRSKEEHGESHASGMRPELGPVSLGNPTQAAVVLRVGLSYSFTSTGAFSEFASLHHPHAQISHTAGDVHVLDVATRKQIVAISPGAIVRVTYDSLGYDVSVDSASYGKFEGPIFFRPTDPANQFRVESIRRSFITTQVPRYRGAIEIARGASTQANRVNVVNVVEAEDYVPGVVVNEGLSSFHIEALKAQAVAARGYAISNLGRWVRLGYPFDIVDSTSSQVYRGIISEHVKAVQAATETRGLVGSYNGQIIEALYSSSFGGHSENNEWIFNSPSTQFPGTNPRAYLRGIYDGDGVPPDFSNEAGVSAFWSNAQPTIFDDCGRVGNRFSRWRFVLTGAQIKSRLTTGRYVLISGNITGNVTNVEVVKRMAASARIGIARITLTTGVVEVRGWDNLRFVLGRPAVSTPALCGTTTISAGFTLTNPSVISVVRNADGSFKDVTVWGGGFGHNVGMSQYGSHGRARAGQNFIQILKAYYTGTDIGSFPIDIGREPGSGPPTLKQQFFAPNAAGRLVIRANGLKGLRVHLNELHDLSFDSEALASGVLTVDVTPYLVAGLNTIHYNPVGRDGEATVFVAID